MLLTLTEAAEVIGVSRQYTHRLIKAGRLDAVRSKRGRVIGVDSAVAARFKRGKPGRPRRTE